MKLNVDEIKDEVRCYRLGESLEDVAIVFVLIDEHKIVSKGFLYLSNGHVEAVINGEVITVNANDMLIVDFKNNLLLGVCSPEEHEELFEHVEGINYKLRTLGSLGKITQMMSKH